jgi:hypothetical protein
VRRKRCPLLRRLPAHVDPVRDHRLRHAVPAHLIQAVTGHQVKDAQQPRDPGHQLARHRRFHDPDPGQPGRPRADLMDPNVVAVAVAALRVVAQQQVRLLFNEQAGELSGRFPGIRRIPFTAHANWLELGWALRGGFWGRGYAAEIGRAGLEFAFGVLRAQAVVSCTVRHNARSRAVMERIGMRYAGEIRSRGMVQGAEQEQDDAPYAVCMLLRKDWGQARSD